MFLIIAIMLGAFVLFPEAGNFLLADIKATLGVILLPIILFLLPSSVKGRIVEAYGPLLNVDVLSRKWTDEHQAAVEEKDAAFKTKHPSLYFYLKRIGWMILPILILFIVVNIYLFFVDVF